MLLALLFVCLADPCVEGQSSDGGQLQTYLDAAERALAEHHNHQDEKAFEKLAQLDPGRAELALSLSELGRFGEALPGLEKGFRRSTDSALKRMAGRQLARAYTGLRNDSKVVEVALELNRLYPQDAELLHHTGCLFGNYAYLTMRTLSEVAPSSGWKHQAAGEACKSQGAAWPSLNTGPYSPSRLSGRASIFGIALTRYPDFQEAQVGMGLNPEDTVVRYYHVAQAYAARGNAAEQQKALAEFQRLRSREAGRRETLNDVFAPREVTKQELDPNAAP